MEVVVVLVDESVPAPEYTKPSSVVADICEYLTVAAVAECRERFPELALAYCGAPQPEACGAGVALVEHALREASIKLMAHLEARMEPDSQNLLLIA